MRGAVLGLLRPERLRGLLEEPEPDRRDDALGLVLRKGTMSKAAPKTAASPAAETKPALADLTKQWATAKAAEELAAREAKRLHAAILEDPKAVIGYADESLVIGSTSELDVEDARLAKILKAEECFDDALESKLSTKKVRALAEINPKVARVVEACTSPKPRFEQASKKK